MIERRAKPIAVRRLIEDCSEGDRVRFLDGAPRVRRGQELGIGPSEYAVVTAFINGGAFVRFLLPPDMKKQSEPTHVLDGARVVREGGYR